MRRNRLRKSNAFDDSDEINPMEGVFNLVDAMLVFSCGLMVSIILHWGVNISPVKLDLADLNELREDIESMQNNDVTVNKGDSYQEMGLVFKDPETGKLYLVSEDEDIN